MEVNWRFGLIELDAGTRENGLMNKLGIERLCVFGMSPVDFVHLVADLGCNCAGMTLGSMPGYRPENYPDWSLRDDAPLRRALTAALQDRDLEIGIWEGFALVPGHDIRGFHKDLDLVRELGGERIACVSLDKDLQATIDGFAVLTEMAADRGLLVSAEMGSLGPYGLVAPALELVHGVGMANFSLLIDSMHFFRLGNTLDDFAAVDPALIGYVQLCDAPWSPRFETYMEEAMYERLAPGNGELPLREFVKLIPPNVTVSLEIPMRSLAQQGVGPRERIAPCIEAARAMLADR
jgi:sugar phosphate isomerase/epimerase